MVCMILFAKYTISLFEMFVCTIGYVFRTVWFVIIVKRCLFARSNWL